MIEKIMKAVKSSNKRRSVNVTIAAVVGMLLSCTSVMGADVTGLEIKNDTGIIFVDRDGREFIPGEVGDPYLENTWDEESNTYTNNTVIFVESADGKAYGLKLSGVNFVNNGSIAGISTNSSNNGYGIYNKDGSIGNITNTGRISGRYYAIYNEDGSIGSITNTGTIISSTYGIGNASSLSTSSITSLINTGNISGSMKGISNNGSSSSIGEIINSGTISGSSGIENYSSTIGKLTNSGIIHGRTNVIYNYGTISNSNNYGLLISNSSSATLSRVTLTNNYGLIFKDYSEKYTATEGDFEKFGIISTEGEYTVINAKAKNDDKDNIGGTENLILEEGTLSYGDSETEVISPDKKYVFNGITDTLKVSGENNKLNNSRVNAYDTAVVMGEDNSILTLNNTVVNGGMKADTTTVNITGEGNKFTAKGNSVINVKDEGTAITVTGSDNAVVLEGNAIVNGEMKSTGSRNILDLNGTGKYGMNMHYDITGFAKMSIDNNVTFFEDMTVTGANEVTVEGTGVLSLRLKKEDLTTTAYGDTKPPTATHAFSGRTGKHQMTIIGNSPEEAGTLNFITNGIGKEILVDMENIELENMKIKTNFIIDKVDLDTYKDEGYIHLGAGSDLGGIINPKVNKYNSLNKIYKSIYNSTDENLDGLRDILSLSTYLGKNYDYNNRIEAEKEEQLASLLGYLTSIYIESPYSYSSELSRRSVGMFRDIVTENEFRPNQDKWLIMGGLTHADGGTKDTYYGQNYHGIDSGSSDTKADMKLTGAYMLGKYGYSENLSLGLTLGGNKSEAKMDMSKVKGNSGYLGAFVENYRGNLTLKTGAGIQYSEYDADRAFGGYSNSDKYSDMTYDIYLNGRYSHQVGENLFLEPYGTLSYTYIKQDGADGGNKTLAIETDSKSFDYTVGKVGVDLKKVIPHEKGKSTLSAGVSYTKILDGADEEHITGRFKGGSDFDILVAHKNEHSLGVNAKYALELENGILFDVKGTYSVERDSHNNSGKNRTKGEWIVGAGLGYKF